MNKSLRRGSLGLQTFLKRLLPLRSRTAHDRVLGREGILAAPPRVSPRRSLRDRERVEALQVDLGIEFADQNILREALTHRSYVNEIDRAWPSNERLEYLGDAVLGLVASNFLFQRFAELEEGELTNLRSALVRTETLAQFAEEMHLGDYLLLGRGEEMSRGRSRPSGLACAFEALLGAMYLDRGYDATREFVMRFLAPRLDTVIEGRTHRNAKSLLQELMQAQAQQTPTYHLIREAGPDHAKTFTVEARLGSRVLGQGVDRSKRAAEQAAAEKALQELESL